MLGAGLLARNAVAARAESEAVGEDVARARLEGRDRVLRAGRPARTTSTQLGFNLVGYGCTTCIGNSGPLPEEISEAVNDARPRRLRGALRQPQLRGPHQPGRADELPRVAAARRRLRARGHDGRRPQNEPLGDGRGRQAGLPARHLADAEEVARHDRAGVSSRTCSRSTLRRRVRRRRALARARRADGRHASRGTTTRPT